MVLPAAPAHLPDVDTHEGGTRGVAGAGDGDAADASQPVATPGPLASPEPPAPKLPPPVLHAIAAPPTVKDPKRQAELESISLIVMDLVTPGGSC